MKATRDAFGHTLAELADENEQLIAVNADLGKATRLSYFQEKHPERFIEVGIAECNMIGIASGLAEHGYRVFLASFASFLTGKYDVIRVSLGYSGAPVVLVGTHAGLAIGKDGAINAALLAASILAINNLSVKKKLEHFRLSQTRSVKKRPK